MSAEDSIARFRSKGNSHVRRTADGRWIEWSDKATLRGRTVGLRADVTALKEHELQIERARAEYKSLVDSLSDAVYAIDMNGRLTFVSAAAAELFGAPVAELLGKGLRELTTDTCDRLLRISAAGSLTTLNVSNAAAITLHMAAVNRRKK